MRKLLLVMALGAGLVVGGVRSRLAWITLPTGGSVAAPWAKIQGVMKLSFNGGWEYRVCVEGMGCLTTTEACYSRVVEGLEEGN